LDYNKGDGTVSRRDPSRPIMVDGKYYIYYTKRQTGVPPIGARNASKATDEIPSTDWDLCDIWYATSEDGFQWRLRTLVKAVELLTYAKTCMVVSLIASMN